MCAIAIISASSVMDGDFVKRLAYKSGYDQQAVQALVYDLQYAQDAPQVSDHGLAGTES